MDNMIPVNRIPESSGESDAEMFRTLTYLVYFFTCKTNKTSTIHRSAYSVIYMFNNLSNHGLITNVQRNPALTSL